MSHKQKSRTIWSCALLAGMAFASAASAASFQGSVVDVLARVDGLERTCELFNYDARLAKCTEKVGKIEAALAGGGFSPLEQKHLRMYQVVEWASLATAQVSRRDYAGAKASLKQGFDGLDRIAPQGGLVYPRIRAIELYIAAVDLATVEGNEAELERLVLEVRQLAATLTPQLGGAVGTEYEAAYSKRLSSLRYEGSLAVEMRLSDYFKAKHGAATGDARATYRDAWIGSISERLALLNARAEELLGGGSVETALAWGETAVQALPLLREAGNPPPAGELRSNIASSFCGDNMQGTLQPGQEARRQRICSAL